MKRTKSMTWNFFHLFLIMAFMVYLLYSIKILSLLQPAITHRLTNTNYYYNRRRRLCNLFHEYRMHVTNINLLLPSFFTLISLLYFLLFFTFLCQISVVQIFLFYTIYISLSLDSHRPLWLSKPTIIIIFLCWLSHNFFVDFYLLVFTRDDAKYNAYNFSKGLLKQFCSYK